MPDQKNLLLLILLAGTLMFCVPFTSPMQARATEATDTTTDTTTDTNQQVESIQTLYRDLVSLSFDFNQLSRSNGRNRHGGGKGVFYRPGTEESIMRWDYSEPDPQIILNNGSKLSIYSKNDNQLIVTSSEELQSDITYAFFSGKRNLTDDFTPLAPDNRFIFAQEDPKMKAIQLLPKTLHNQIKSLHIWFDGEFLIHKLIMEDHFGSLTELTFSNIRLNELPAASPETVAELVRLELPPDTEIIRQ